MVIYEISYLKIYYLTSKITRAIAQASVSTPFVPQFKSILSRSGIPRYKFIEGIKM